MRKASFLLLVLFIMNIGLTSCDIRNSLNVGKKEGNSATTPKNEGDIMDRGPVKGGVLRLFSTMPDTLNPILTKNVYVRDLSEFVFESLVSLDRNQIPVPELADKWEVSKDGLSWTFYLKNNINWHDGMPLTAEDVEFTFETILNTKTNSVYKSNLENIAAFTAIGRNVIKVILKEPNSFTAELMTFPIISKHYFAGEDMQKTGRNMTPMGTGPYRFLSYDGKNLIKLILNEKWWKIAQSQNQDQAVPYISELDVVLYKNSKDALNAFQTNDIDVTFIDSGDFSKYQGRNDIALKKYPSNKYDFISINHSNPVLKEKSVRQAMAYAIDKVELINKVMQGEAVAVDIPVLPDTWLYNSDILYYNSSSKKAREILTEDGWKENRDTGVYYKTLNGVYSSLTFDILVNDDNEIRIKAAEEISRQLGQAGIKLNVVKTKWDDEFKKLNTKKYDLALLGWSIPSTEDMSFAYSSLNVDTNVAGYKNADVDGYLKQILIESDDNRKKTLFYNMRSMINDDVPYIGLYFYYNAVLFNKRVKGDSSPYLWGKYNDFAKWYIPIQVR
jgi:peptide/nickel transport system substrate-binding protein